MDLSGWILTGSATSQDALAIADGFQIAPNATALISNYEFENEKTTLAIESNLITSSLSLSNSTLEIMLAMPDGTVIDSVTKDQQVGSSNPFISMTRTENGDWEESVDSQNLLDADQLGTPGIHLTALQTSVPEETEEEVIMSEENPEVLEEQTEEQPEERETTVVCQTVYVDTGEVVGDVENVETDEIVEDEPDTEELEETPEPEEEIMGEPESEPINIRLNEIVSDPEDGIEWVEILNEGTNEANLLDWGIMEASGKLTAFPNVTLQPNEFYIVEDPAGNLNNSGDSVYLYDASGFVVDEVTYGDDSLKAPKKGESLVRMENAWIITDVIKKANENIAPELTVQMIEPTQNEEQEPGAEESEESENTEHTEEEELHNVIAIADQTGEDQNSETEESSESENEDDGTEVVNGVITVEPGLLGKQIAFINGVQLYFHSADWPELFVGDVVTVKGTPSESNGESRIKISSAEDIEVTGQEDPIN